MACGSCCWQGLAQHPDRMCNMTTLPSRHDTAVSKCELSRRTVLVEHERFFLGREKGSRSWWGARLEVSEEADVEKIASRLQAPVLCAERASRRLRVLDLGGSQQHAPIARDVAHEPVVLTGCPRLTTSPEAPSKPHTVGLDLATRICATLSGDQHRPRSVIALLVARWVAHMKMFLQFANLPRQGLVFLRALCRALCQLIAQRWVGQVRGKPPVIWWTDRPLCACPGTHRR